MKVIDWAKEMGQLYTTQYKSMWALPKFPFDVQIQGDTVVFRNILGKIERVSTDYFKISN